MGFRSGAPSQSFSIDAPAHDTQGSLRFLTSQRASVEQRPMRTMSCRGTMWSPAFSPPRGRCREHQREVQRSLLRRYAPSRHCGCLPTPQWRLALRACRAFQALRRHVTDGFLPCHVRTSRHVPSSTGSSPSTRSTSSTT